MDCKQTRKIFPYLGQDIYLSFDCNWTYYFYQLFFWQLLPHRNRFISINQGVQNIVYVLPCKILLGKLDCIIPLKTKKIKKKIVQLIQTRKYIFYMLIVFHMFNMFNILVILIILEIFLRFSIFSRKIHFRQNTIKTQKLQCIIFFAFIGYNVCFMFSG